MMEKVIMSLAETTTFSLEKNLLEKGGQKIPSFILSSLSPLLYYVLVRFTSLLSVSLILLSCHNLYFFSHLN